MKYTYKIIAKTTTERGTYNVVLIDGENTYYQVRKGRTKIQNYPCTNNNYIRACNQMFDLAKYDLLDLFEENKF